MLKRNIQIAFRLTEQEFQELEQKVKMSGFSREAYIRSVLGGYVPKEKPPPDYRAMMRELHAIGNNIHQIAARANATGFFMKDEYDRYYHELKDAMLRFQRAVTKPEKL